MGTKIGVGLIGPGFIANTHVDALRRLGNVEILALADATIEGAQAKAAQLNIPTAYDTITELLDHPGIDVIHNTTPNHLHFPVSMAVIKAGKHIVSEKPLALNSEQCRTLRDAAEAAGVVNAVMFNSRGNPLVQHMRAMVAGGQIGTPVFVKGQYLQDWLTDEKVFSWRLDPKLGSKSSALADIGSHTCDVAEHVTGLKIIEVLADLGTVVKTRYTSGSTNAFSGKSEGELQSISIEGEDIATAMLRFTNGVKGVITVGQVLPGHKNDLQLEVNGRVASLNWKLQSQNDLWIGRFDSPNTLLQKDPSLLLPDAKSFANLPGGHQEGWSDAFFNVMREIYAWIQTGEKSGMVSSFADATHITEVVDAMLRSHESGNIWVTV